MSTLHQTSDWDDDFFNKFTNSRSEYDLLKESLTITISFKALILLDDYSKTIARFIMCKTQSSQVFIGYYINKSNNNFLMTNRDKIKLFCEKNSSTEMVGPIDINIFNQYRYINEVNTWIDSKSTPDTKNINDFLEFGFNIGHKWYLMSYPRLTGLLHLFKDILKARPSSLPQLEVRNTADLDDIYKVATDSYKDMPYFEDPGPRLFKLWNNQLLDHYNENERIFYFKNNKLVAFCLFKNVRLYDSSRIIFSHIGRNGSEETKGISRDIHFRLIKAHGFKHILNPPLFDLVHENSPIFNYLPLKHFNLHKTYISLSFTF